MYFEKWAAIACVSFSHCPQLDPIPVGFRFPGSSVSPFGGSCWLGWTRCFCFPVTYDFLDSGCPSQHVNYQTQTAKTKFKVSALKASNWYFDVACLVGCISHTICLSQSEIRSCYLLFTYQLHWLFAELIVMNCEGMGRWQLWPRLKPHTRNLF